MLKLSIFFWGQSLTEEAEKSLTKYANMIKLMVKIYPSLLTHNITRNQGSCPLDACQP